jgi:hypothetical protein
MIVTISAIVFAILSVAIILFHLGLTLGMPWGEASMGSKYPGKYPPKMRVVSFINIFILIIIGVTVLTEAELIFPRLKSFSNTAIYFVVSFSALETILNLITPSKIERKIWAPVAVILLVTSIIVAFKLGL